MNDFSKQLQMLRNTGMLPQQSKQVSSGEQEIIISKLIELMMTFGWTIEDLRELPLPTLRQINLFFFNQNKESEKSKNKMPRVPNIRSLKQLRM